MTLILDKVSQARKLLNEALQNSVVLAHTAPLKRHFFLLWPQMGSLCCCGQVEPAYDLGSILAHKTAPEIQ